MYALRRITSSTVAQLKHLKAQRFKPKFDDEENQKLDLTIDILVTDLTIVIPFLKFC